MAQIIAITLSVISTIGFIYLTFSLIKDLIKYYKREREK